MASFVDNPPPMFNRARVEREAMTTPRDAIAGHPSLIDEIRYLASPDAERMPDFQRINRFVTVGCEAATALDTLQARVKELEAERLQVRGILAGSDYGSLPNDWKLERIADARMNDVHDLRWQVKDTCSRAEAAESRATRAEQERDKLQGMLLLCGELGGIGKDETPAAYLRRLIDGMIDAARERDEAYERAAQAAELFGDPYILNNNTGAMMFRAVTEKIAAAIRRLAAGTEKEGK
jgi:hypothetical protein